MADQYDSRYIFGAQEGDCCLDPLRGLVKQRAISLLGLARRRQLHCKRGPAAFGEFAAQWCDDGGRIGVHPGIVQDDGPALQCSGGLRGVQAEEFIRPGVQPNGFSCQCCVGAEHVTQAFFTVAVCGQRQPGRQGDDERYKDFCHQLGLDDPAESEKISIFR